MAKETIELKIERIKINDPEEAILILQAQIDYIVTKNDILVNSLERIASGMLTAGESKEEAQMSLLKNGSSRR